MMTLEVISIFRDIIVVAAALMTAIVAAFGLKSWKRELRGKTEFEAARNLMRATYRVRDKVQAARTPLVFTGEFPHPGDAEREQEAEEWAYVYKNRWAPVREALQDFDLHVLEAEALWGSDIRVKTDKLIKCAKKLETAIKAFIHNKESGGEDFRADKKFKKEVESDLFSLESSSNNVLYNKIRTAVNSIEDFARPRLARPHLRRK